MTGLGGCSTACEPSGPSGSGGLLGSITGGMFTFSPLEVTVFWLVAGPLGYLVTAGYFLIE